MLKKLILFTLSALLVFALAACSANDEPQAPENDNAPSTSQPESDKNESASNDAEQSGSDNAPENESTAPESGSDEPVSSEPETEEEPEKEPEAGKPEADAPQQPVPEEPSEPEEPSASEKPSDPQQPAGDADISFSINDIWEDIRSSLGDSLPALDSLDADTMTILYPVSTGDLAEFGCYASLMNVKASEFFIAKVESGKMDAVKSALLSRQSDLDTQWKQYLPDQYALVENYKLVQNGDYIFFGIAEKIDDAVAIFNKYTK